jgi:hypothetical protein
MNSRDESPERIAGGPATSRGTGRQEAVELSTSTRQRLVRGQRTQYSCEILRWERLSRPPRLSESDGGQAAAI